MALLRVPVAPFSRAWNFWMRCRKDGSVLQMSGSSRGKSKIFLGWVTSIFRIFSQNWLYESFAAKDWQHYTSAIDNYCWKGWKCVFEGCAVFSVAFRLNTSQRTLPSDITIISYRPHKSNTRNRRSGFMVICWNIFKKTRNSKHPNWIIYSNFIKRFQIPILFSIYY